MEITRRGFLSLFGKAVAVAATTPLAGRAMTTIAPVETFTHTPVGSPSVLRLRERPKLIDGLEILEWRLECEREYRVDVMIGGGNEISTGRRLAHLDVKAYFDNPMMYTSYLEEEDMVIQGSGYPGLDGKWKLVKFELADGALKVPLQDLHFIRLYDGRFA